MIELDVANINKIIIKTLLNDDASLRVMVEQTPVISYQIIILINYVLLSTATHY